MEEVKKSGLPSYSKIVEYWKDKCMDLDTGKIMQYKESQRNNTQLIIYDIGEPCCWACGADAMCVEHDGAGSLFKIWDNKYTKSRLQRCHILARQFGGSDSVENLFLLCDQCHKESPDTLNSNNFFLWVTERRKKGSRVSEIMNTVFDILDAKNVDAIALEEFLKNNQIDYRKVMQETLSRCGLHEFSISCSSIAYSFADVFVELMEKQLDVNEFI